jgi:hypothetical protein
MNGEVSTQLRQGVRNGSAHNYMMVPYARMWDLRARVADYERRGLIAQGSKFRELVRTDPATGRREKLYVARVRWLRRPMPLKYRLMSWAAMALGGLAGLSYLVWQSRWVLLYAALAALVLAAIAGLAAISSNGSGQCAGVHVKH